MSFPDLPFTLEGDDELISYLKSDLNHFSFLRPKTMTIVAGLPCQDLGKCRKILCDLWPMIVIDALFKLRETDGEIENADVLGGPIPNWNLWETFFPEEALSREEVTKLFKGFSQFESMLYGASPERYRDHLAHVFRVWICGHGLIKSQLKYQLRIPEKNLNQTLPVGQSEWECMWALSALCHDLGYPIKYIETINQRSREAFGELGLHPAGDLQFRFSPQARLFQDAMIRFIASSPEPLDPPVSHGDRLDYPRYATHLQNKYYVKLLQSFDDLDHGVISALLLSKCLVHFLEGDLCHDPWRPLRPEAARQFLMRREILRAIAFHSCPEVYHVQFNTLAFILFILDEAQDWGRPTFDEMWPLDELPPSVTTRISDFGQDNIAVEMEYGNVWSKDDFCRIKKKIGGLHKRIRLGAGSSLLGQNQRLEFKLKDKTKREVCLRLVSRKLETTGLEEKNHVSDGGTG